MHKRKSPVWVLLFVFLYFPAVSFARVKKLHSPTAHAQVFLPGSKYKAGVPEPPCNNGVPSSSSAILTALGRTIDNFAIGAPIVSASLGIPGVSQKLKDIMGTNDGKAVCAPMCVVIPATAKVIQEDACAKDLQGRKCNMVQGHSPNPLDYYASVQPLGNQISEDKQLVCTVAKNWAHNRPRTITWRVWY